MENILQIKHFSFAYPEQKRLTLTDIDLSVGRGEFLVLCGPSGCGKSTLLRQLKTVLAPHGERQGEILCRVAGRAGRETNLADGHPHGYQRDSGGELQLETVYSGHGKQRVCF